jgi:hypothetical protein
MRKDHRTSAREMRPEYRFDYRLARPNRFAGKIRRDCLTEVLEPDVASVFASSESVNALLRSVIAALPARQRAASRRIVRKAS